MIPRTLAQSTTVAAVIAFASLTPSALAEDMPPPGPIYKIVQEDHGDIAYPDTKYQATYKVYGKVTENSTNFAFALEDSNLPDNFSISRRPGSRTEAILRGDLQGVSPGTYNFMVTAQSLDETTGEPYGEPYPGGFSLTVKDWQAPGAFATVETASRSACGINTAGKVFCWGTDDDGQLGNGAEDTTTHLATTPVVGIPDRAKLLDISDSRGCAITVKNDMYCWGTNSSNTINTTDADIAHEATLTRRIPPYVRHIALGDDVTCVANQSVWCWGDEKYLGGARASRTNSPVRVRIPEWSGVADLAAGTNHLCAVLRSGSVWCWGENSHQQAGDGATQFIKRPQKVDASFGKATTVTASATHSCVISADQDMWCWGDNTWEKLGIEAEGSHYPPVKPTNLDGVKRPGADSADQAPTASIKQVSAGPETTCGVFTDGHAFCLGNTRGINYLDLLQPMPRIRRIPQLPHGGGWADSQHISAGKVHCAVNSTGQVHCAGSNSDGQLGVGTMHPTIGRMDQLKQ